MSYTSLAPEFMEPNRKKFGDPFILPSTDSFPRDIKGTMDLCLYLWRMNKVYAAVAQRVVTYFITDIEFEEEGDSDAKRELKRTLTEVLSVLALLQRAGLEWAVYGNGFIRCVEPFDRYLIDKRGGEFKAIALSAYPESEIRYNWETLTYTVPDLRTALLPENKGRPIGRLPKVDLPFQDKPSAAPERFSVVFLDPRYITLDKAHHSSSIQYIYTIPPGMESRIKSNIHHEIAHTPRGLLEAVAQNKDYRFHGGEVYHFRAPSPAGVSDAGWSCPEVLLHYDTLFQLQVYRKADFAVAQDYLHPFRVFSPAMEGGGDQAMLMLMSQWRSEISRMISTHRHDPTAMHALPFRPHFDEFGGNGKNFVLHDVVETYMTTLFDGMGFPQELFRGSLNVQQAPNAIRMFERSYEWLYQMLNGLLQFISATFQRSQDSSELKLRLKRPTMAYDTEWMQTKLQLAANREIPRADVYPELGIQDPEGAVLRAAKEDQEIQIQQQENQRAFQARMQGGSMADSVLAATQGGAPPPPGGAPPPPAGGGAPGGGAGGQQPDYAVDPGADPLQIQQRASEIAQQWQQMHEQRPNSQRQEMQRCEATNPTLYAAAKQQLEELRRKGASAGRSQASQAAAQ